MRGRDQNIGVLSGVSRCNRLAVFVADFDYVLKLVLAYDVYQIRLFRVSWECEFYLFVELFAWWWKNFVSLDSKYDEE